MLFRSDGFVVKEGSQSPMNEVPSIPGPVSNVREGLRSKGLFAEENAHFRLTQDYTFSSPSLAASVMLGRAANGRIEWKDSTGRTLKSLQESA